jgi:hypothetical protein
MKRVCGYRRVVAFLEKLIRGVVVLVVAFEEAGRRKLGGFTHTIPILLNGRSMSTYSSAFVVASSEHFELKAIAWVFRGRRS